MIGVPAYRFTKATSCVSQLEAHGTRLGAVVDRRELPLTASFDLAKRRAAVAATEARVTLDTGFMPASQASRWRSTPGDDGTLARANHRLISASYREVRHAACER